MTSDASIEAVLQHLVQRIRAELPGVCGIWLFGSHARGEAQLSSDIDLAVLGTAPFDPVAIFDLGLTLGVVAQRDVDLVDLRRAPVVLKKEIVTDGCLIAVVEPSACETYAADAMALYVAFRDELALASRDAGGSR